MTAGKRIVPDFHAILPLLIRCFPQFSMFNLYLRLTHETLFFLGLGDSPSNMFEGMPLNQLAQFF